MIISSYERRLKALGFSASRNGSPVLQGLAGAAGLVLQGLVACESSLLRAGGYFILTSLPPKQWCLGTEHAAVRWEEEPCGCPGRASSFPGLGLTCSGGTSELLSTAITLLSTEHGLFLRITCTYLTNKQSGPAGNSVAPACSLCSL